MTKKTKTDEKIDFDALEGLADGHIPEGWHRVREIKVTCDVSRRGVSWCIEVHAVSDRRRAHRYLHFTAPTLDRAVALATRILRHEWDGWQLYEDR